MNYRILLNLLSCLWLPALASTDTTKANEPSGRKHMTSMRHTWYTSDYFLLGQHFGTADYKNKGYPLGIALSYGRVVGARNYLGATLSYERQTGAWNKEYMGYSYKYGRSAMNHVVGNFTRNSITFAVEYTHAYVTRKHFQCYTVAGLGITAYKVALEYDSDYYARHYPYPKNEAVNKAQQKRDVHFNANYSPVGIAVGGNLRWFTEIGFGYKGLLNTGVAYKF